MSFLQAYPAEAGKQDQERIIPFMPGPLEAVDDDITGKEREREREREIHMKSKCMRVLSFICISMFTCFSGSSSRPIRIL